MADKPITNAEQSDNLRRKSLQGELIRVGVVTFGKGRCEHTVEAINGTEAKKIAIAEHKENCRWAN